MDYDLVAFVIRSQPRRLILGRLMEGVSTPSMMSTSLNVNRTHISRALKELQEKDLVICLTDSRKGRVYGITDKGTTIMEEIKRSKL